MYILCECDKILQTYTVADPGFPVGGRRPRSRVPTPEVATF